MSSHTKILLSALSLCLICLTQGTAGNAEEDALSSLEVLSRVRRVIGGDEVEEGDWPYLVHLAGKVPKTMFWGIPLSYNMFYCGGSVLNKRWILTAAHCFKQHHYQNPNRMMTPKYWHAKVGEVESEHGILDGIMGRWHRLIGNKDKGLWFLHAERIIIHPEYNEFANWKNDLALIRVEEDLPVSAGENPNVGTVKLPTDVTDSSWPTAGTRCIMKGWGCSARGGNVAATARAANMPAVGDVACRLPFPGLGLDTRVCAGEVDGRVGICRGDSGGPLVCEWQGAMVQAGVASFTSATNPGKVPGVFTSVKAYLPWILETISH